MNIQEWVQWGLDNLYLVSINSNIKLTNNLKRDYDTIYSGDRSNTSSLVVQQKKPTRQSVSLGDIEVRYKQFQEDACVPFRIVMDNGGQYTSKTKSKKALDIFSKLLSNPDINYQALVLSTRTYYENKKLFRKPLAKYFEEDIWEAYYDETIKLASSGKLEAHVKQITSSNTSNTESI